jgi:hypothetical protein
MTTATSTVLPTLTVRTVSDATSFIHGQLGVSPTSIRGQIEVTWPQSDSSNQNNTTIIPVHVAVKLSVKEWTSADNRLLDDRDVSAVYQEKTNNTTAATSSYRPGKETRVHMHSTLWRDIKAVWPPEAVDIEEKDDDHSMDSNEEGEAYLQGGTASPTSEAVQAAMARGFLHLPFELAVPDHLPSSITLPHGAINYKLSVIFTYTKRMGGPHQRMKSHFMLPLERYTDLPSLKQLEMADITNNDMHYHGINLEPFSLECQLDEAVVAEATLPYPCLTPGGVMLVQVRLKDTTSEDDDVTLLQSYASRLQHIALVLHRVDSYRVYSSSMNNVDIASINDNDDTNTSSVSSTVSLGVEIISAECPIDFNQLTSLTGQTNQFACPPKLVSTVKTQLLEVTYIYLVRLQLDDRAVEFFFPLDAVKLPNPTGVVAVNTPADQPTSNLTSKLMHQLGHLFGKSQHQHNNSNTLVATPIDPNDRETEVA